MSNHHDNNVGSRWEKNPYQFQQFVEIRKRKYTVTQKHSRLAPLDKKHPPPPEICTAHDVKTEIHETA